MMLAPFEFFFDDIEHGNDIAKTATGEIMSKRATKGGLGIGDRMSSVLLCVYITIGHRD